jgi:phage terminase large subunit-like protein
VLKGKNGTYIDFITYDQDYSAAESVTLDGISADEELPEKFYSGSLPRLMARNGAIWISVTPLHRMTWALKFWEKTDDPDIDVFKFGFDDNPHLDPEWKKTFIANCPENERASRIDGTFLEFSGLVYPELDSHTHFLPEPRAPQAHWPVICAVDPHQRKGTFVTWAHVDPSDSVTFFDELRVKGTVEEAIRAIREKEATHKARTQLRVIDPAANKQISGYGSDTTTLDEFIDKGMGFTLADNNRAGYNAVREYLKFDKTKPVSALNRPSAYFTKDVPQTWDAMTHLLWDEYRFGRESRDPKETVKDFAKDFPDCVRYTLALRPTSRSNDLSPVDMRFQPQSTIQDEDSY